MPFPDNCPDCKHLLAAAIHARRKLSDYSQALHPPQDDTQRQTIFAAGVLDLIIEVAIGILEKVMQDKADNGPVQPPPPKS
jgi:hypothetical protein